MQTGLVNNIPFSRIRGIFFAALVLFQNSIWAGDASNKPVEQTQNPHGDSSSCITCHLFTDANEPLLKGNTLRLCQSCHMSNTAIHVVHPMNRASQSRLIDAIPNDFPVHNGRLTCLTCHDVTPDCRLEPGYSESNPHFLRRSDQQNPLAFCFHCHTEQTYVALNVHDQLQTDRINTDTCLWCHTHDQKDESSLIDSVHYPMRPNSSDICINCHTVAENHPTGGPHLYAKPSDDMLWYISAYELHSRMSLSIKELIVFVRAAQRTPRSIPLDEQGRIICVTCHNPHEAGLFRQGSDHAVGAEPKQAIHHRLRAAKGQMCVTCHQM